MDYKKILLEWLKDKNKLYQYRKKTSQIFFVFSSLLFITNLFLLWNRFYEEILSKTFIFTYYIFIISMCFYLYFLLSNFLNKTLKTILIIILLISFLILSLSFSWISI